MLRTFHALLTSAMLTLLVPNSAAATAAVSERPARSATKARDIGGFALGMHARDAAKLSSLEGIGNGQYRTTKDGIIYDFSVTPLGRIYRIDSEQLVGRFIVDDAFLRELAAKLIAKYGPPENATAGNFKWSLIEPVKRTGGDTLPFETNWASAYVGRDTDGVTVHVKMIDFRVLWEDETSINRTPREIGVDAIRL